MWDGVSNPFYIALSSSDRARFQTKKPSRDQLPDVDGSTMGRFWWQAVDPYLDKPILTNLLDYTRENVPEGLFCPSANDPFPKMYMLTRVEITHSFLNGVERDRMMGSGLIYTSVCLAEKAAPVIRNHPRAA